MAATHLRSASGSTASTNTSTTSTKTTVDGVKKKFSCNHPGCGKSFSRSEHLHRHALNHKDGTNTCTRCSAHFRRRDLLDRHMARHKEKDDEAGGEGLGVLATRKRLWRDADGNIVNARRPSYTPESGNKRRMINKSTESQDQRTTEQERRVSTGGNHLPPSPVSMTRADSIRSTIIVDTNSRQQHMYPILHEVQPKIEHEEYSRAPWYQSSTGPSLLSPTGSASTYSEPESSLQSESQSPAAELDTLYEDAWPMNHNVLPQILNHSPPINRESAYPASPGWGPQPSFQTFMGAIGEYEEPQPMKQAYGQEMNGMYGWQNPWNVGSQTMLSRCREEKFEPLMERSNGFPGQDGMRRGFSMGGC